MNTKTWFHVLIIIIVVVAGFLLRFHSARGQGDAEIIQATITRTCAPWDGAAFTVFVPIRDGLAVEISVWKFPEIPLPLSYSFPDETGRIGGVLLIRQAGLPVQLTGRVFFRQVDRTGPVVGWFDLLTDTGRRFKGKFKAKWGDFAAICG